VNELDKIADQAEDQIIEAYWRACDAKQAAIHPDDLVDQKWVRGLLDEAYEVALQREDLVACGRAASWFDAAQLTG